MLFLLHIIRYNTVIDPGQNSQRLCCWADLKVRLCLLSSDPLPLTGCNNGDLRGGPCLIFVSRNHQGEEFRSPVNILEVF